MILNRFSKKFALEALEFILGNNNFKFDEMFYNQTEGTETGTKCVPPYACLGICYKEKTRLFTIELPNFSELKKFKFLKRIQTIYGRWIFIMASNNEL